MGSGNKQRGKRRGPWSSGERKVKVMPQDGRSRGTEKARAAPQSESALAMAFYVRLLHSKPKP